MKDDDDEKANPVDTDSLQQQVKDIGRRVGFLELTVCVICLGVLMQDKSLKTLERVVSGK